MSNFAIEPTDGSPRSAAVKALLVSFGALAKRNARNRAERFRAAVAGRDVSRSFDMTKKLNVLSSESRSQGYLVYADSQS